MVEPDVEAGGDAPGELIVPTGEDHLVAVDLVLVEPVRVEVSDPRPALLLDPVAEELADLVDPLRRKARSVEGALGDVEVGVAGRGGRDLLDEQAIGLGDVLDPLRGGGGVHTRTVSVEVLDRSAAGLEAADRVLDAGDAELLHEFPERRVVDPVDPRGTEVDGEVRGAVGVHPSADAVATLQHEHRLAGVREHPRRGHARHPGADHDRVVRGHWILLRVSPGCAAPHSWHGRWAQGIVVRMSRVHTRATRAE